MMFRYTVMPRGGHFAPTEEPELLAEEIDVPLLAKVPLETDLREGADEGRPLVVDKPDAPAAQAIRQAARGILAMTPEDLPMMAAPVASDPPPGPKAPGPGATELPVIQ